LLQLHDFLVRLGTLPHEQALGSLRLFAEEVMPVFTGRAEAGKESPDENAHL
jgi:hypothetical protein